MCGQGRRQTEPTEWGTAVAKVRPGVCDAVEGAVQKALSGGYYGQVLNRWNVHTGAVDAVTVNSGR